MKELTDDQWNAVRFILDVVIEAAVYVGDDYIDYEINLDRISTFSLTNDERRAIKDLIRP